MRDAVMGAEVREIPLVINPDAFVARNLFAVETSYRPITRVHRYARKAPRLMLCYWCRTGKHAQCVNCGCSCRPILTR